MRRRSISLDNVADFGNYESELLRSKLIVAVAETHTCFTAFRNEKQQRIQLKQELDHLIATLHDQNEKELAKTETGLALTRAQSYIKHLQSTIRYFQEKTGEYGHVIENSNGDKTWEAYLSMPESTHIGNAASGNAKTVCLPGVTTDGYSEMFTYIVKQMKDAHHEEIQQIHGCHYWEMQNTHAFYSNLMHEWEASRVSGLISSAYGFVAAGFPSPIYEKHDFKYNA